MPTDSRIGEELAAYRIESMVGRGGMGVVYCAQHVHLERQVALKLLAPALADNEEFRRRFIRESRAAASIRHPNIVTVYDAGEADGHLYIAMQLIEGTDLATLLRQEQRLSPDQALDIIEQIGSALDSAHSRGLVHRDVKPGNIMIDSEGAYLTDFGLTKRTSVKSSSTSADQFLGTVDYVAPEQIAGKELDGRTDVYALGCVLYECLTGEAAFRRESEMATLYAHMHDEPPRVTDKRPDLPVALDDVIARALAKEREDRHGSCAELVSDASVALVGSAAAARTRRLPRQPAKPMAIDVEAPTGMTARLTTSTRGIARRLRERRGPAIALGLIVLVAGAALAALALTGSDDDPTPTPPPRPSAEPAAEFDTRDIRVGRRPFGIALGGDGSLWVANSASDTITRIDSRSGRATGASIPAGDSPNWVSTAEGRLWVANTVSDSVTRIDPTTGDKLNEIPVGRSPSGIAGGFGTMWVANEGSDTVSAIDTTNPTAPVAHIKVGDRPRGLATTNEHLWVLLRRDGAVMRLDGQTMQPVGEPIRVGRDPMAIAIKRDVVWITNSDDDTVMRLSTRTGRRIGDPIRVGRAPFGIAIGLGSVWVANSGSNTVTRLSQRTGRRRGKSIRVGRQPIGVKVQGRHVYVSNNNSNTVTRITP